MKIGKIYYIDAELSEAEYGANRFPAFYVLKNQSSELVKFIAFDASGNRSEGSIAGASFLQNIQPSLPLYKTGPASAPVLSISQASSSTPGSQSVEHFNRVEALPANLAAKQDKASTEIPAPNSIYKYVLLTNEVGVPRKLALESYIAGFGYISQAAVMYYLGANYYTQAQIDSRLTSVYKPKPSVATASALPLSGNTLGDVRNVIDTGMNYAWVDVDGTPTWDAQGGIMDLSSYATQLWVESQGYLTEVSWNDIDNQPDFADVAFSGSYNDLLDTPLFPVPEPHVNADWTALGGPAEILNKPNLGVYALDYTVVHKTGNETIDGEKTFTASTFFPAGTLIQTDGNVVTENWGSAYQWNEAFQDRHTHDNKAVLDGIASTNVSNWNTSYTQSHTHSNKAFLDTLNAGAFVDLVSLKLNSNMPNLAATNYGSYAGIINDATNGPVASDWHHTIKMLHSNSEGYYTAIAVKMTGDEGMYHRRMTGGVTSSWRRVWDNFDFNIADYVTRVAFETAAEGYMKKTETQNVSADFDIASPEGSWATSLFNKGTFVNGINAADNSRGTGYWAIETANGFGNTNFPSDSTYGVYQRLKSNTFTTDIMFQNGDSGGGMYYKTWYHGSSQEGTISSWKRVLTESDLPNYGSDTQIPYIDASGKFAYSTRLTYSQTNGQQSQAVITLKRQNGFTVSVGTNGLLTPEGNGFILSGQNPFIKRGNQTLSLGNTLGDEQSHHLLFDGREYVFPDKNGTVMLKEDLFAENPSADIPSDSTLNSTYPNAPVGFEVFFPNLFLTGHAYITIGNSMSDEKEIYGKGIIYKKTNRGWMVIPTYQNDTPT